jgi:toxin CptA
MAIQRGNTCTVVAIDDLLHRRSWHRVQAIAYIWLLVAGGLTLTRLVTGDNPAPAAVPVATWSALGGLLLGLGAVINGACSTGTIARIGSGEYAYGFTVAGFFLGCLLAPHIFGRLASEHPRTAPAFTSLDYPVLAVLGMAAVLALTTRRLAAGPHESFRDFLRSAWDPRTATLILALLFVAAVQIDGPWSYTDMLGDLARGRTAHLPERGLLFVALLSGAIVAGRSMQGARLVGPLKGRVVRCAVGGLIMGFGFSIAPGAFEGDTLLGQPLLLGYAWVAMSAAYLSIVLGLTYLRSRAGRRIASLRPDPAPALSPDRGTTASTSTRPE